MLLVTHFINIFRSSWKKTLVLKTPWFLRRHGSQYTVVLKTLVLKTLWFSTVVLKTPWFSKLASLHVESKTTILYSKRYVVFFSENCTSVHSDSWRVETPCTVRWEGEKKRQLWALKSCFFFSSSHDLQNSVVCTFSRLQGIKIYWKLQFLEYLRT